MLMNGRLFCLISVEQALHLVQKALAAFVLAAGGDRVEFTQELFLFFRHALGHFHLHVHQQVALQRRADAGETLAALFSFRAGPTALFWLRENAVLLAVSVACCVPPVIEAGRRLLGRHTALRCACMLAALLICLAALAKSSYNPFIYFRF